MLVHVRIYVSMLEEVYYREAKIWNSDSHTLIELSKYEIGCLMRKTDWLLVLSRRVISIMNKFFSSYHKVKTN